MEITESIFVLFFASCTDPLSQHIMIMPSPNYVELIVSFRVCAKSVICGMYTRNPVVYIYECVVQIFCLTMMMISYITFH